MRRQWLHRHSSEVDMWTGRIHGVKEETSVWNGGSTALLWCLRMNVKRVKPIWWTRAIFPLVFIIYFSRFTPFTSCIHPLRPPSSPSKNRKWNNLPPKNLDSTLVGSPQSIVKRSFYECQDVEAWDKFPRLLRIAGLAYKLRKLSMALCTRKTF